MEIPFFQIVIVLVLVETILSARWVRIYFENGIPLFSKNITSNKIVLKSNFSVDVMSNKFKSSGYTPSFYFKELDKNTIAFREKLFEFSWFAYTPIMHGKISINSSYSEVKVTGLANWFPIFFILFWYSTLMSNFSIKKDFLFLFAPVLIFGVIYFIQRKKHKEIISYLTEMVG